MFVVVAPFITGEFVVIAPELQRGFHLLVGEPPISELIVDVVFTCLQEDSNWLPFGFPNQCRADMASANVKGRAEDPAGRKR